MYVERAGKARSDARIACCAQRYVKLVRRAAWVLTRTLRSMVGGWEGGRGTHIHCLLHVCQEASELFGEVLEQLDSIAVRRYGGSLVRWHFVHTGDDYSSIRWLILWATVLQGRSASSSLAEGEPRHG